MSVLPEQFRYLESLSKVDLERELTPFANKLPQDLTDEEVRKACTIHRLLSRSTAGPPKTKSAAAQLATRSLADIFSSIIKKPAADSGTSPESPK